MSMYNLFQTDKELEKNGVVIDYGSFRVTLGRAGGANKKFTRLLEAKTKPHRRAMKTETMEDEAAFRVLREVYSLAAIFRWENKKELQPDGTWTGEFVDGIEPPDGSDKLIKPTPTNIEKTLEALPDLFLDLKEQSEKVSLYRVQMLEEDAKN